MLKMLSGACYKRKEREGGKKQGVQDCRKDFKFKGSRLRISSYSVGGTNGTKMDRLDTEERIGP